jgi:hypothetical protein
LEGRLGPVLVRRTKRIIIELREAALFAPQQ